MPLRFALAFALCAATALAHGASAPMGFDDARHLLVRTGFGPTDADIRQFAGLARGEAVAQILRDTRTTAVTAPPSWVNDTGALRYPRPDTATAEERRAFQQVQ